MAFQKKSAVVDDETIPTFEVAERMAQHGTAADMRESEVCDLLDESKFPRITRQVVDPRTSKTRDVAMSSFVTTWVHAAEPGRLHHVINTLGWKPVHVKWLKPGTMSGAWQTSPEGYLTRGEKGEDVACLMPRHLHEERMRKLALGRSERARDVARIKTNTAESLAADGQHAAADRIARSRMEVMQFNETKGIGAAGLGTDARNIVPESEQE